MAETGGTIWQFVGEKEPVSFLAKCQKFLGTLGSLVLAGRQR